jgi:probable DNA metabolism protein
MTIYNINKGLTEFFTAVFYAYSKKDSIICADNNIQLNLNDEIIDIIAEIDKAERVINFISKYDRSVILDIKMLFRSDDRDIYQIAFDYIKQLVKEKQKIREYLSNPYVILFNEKLKKIWNEVHRFTGFIRFMENDSGIFYSHYQPDYDITELLMPHFISRYKKMPFVIHDTNRNILGMYNGEISKIVKSEQTLTVYLSDNESNFTKLWKLYYDTVNIKERKNTKQMKSYMPVRYWKNMPEKQENFD